MTDPDRAGIRLKPEPYCPECGGRMILRRPGRAGGTWEPFWGCAVYPECNGTRDILPDGTPEGDDYD